MRTPFRHSQLSILFIDRTRSLTRGEFDSPENHALRAELPFSLETGKMTNHQQTR